MVEDEYAAAAEPKLVRKRRKQKRPRSSVEGSIKKRRGSRRKARLVAVIAAVWVLLVAGTAVTMRILYPEKAQDPIIAANTPPPAISDQDQTFLSEHGTEIYQEFLKFVSDTSPTARAAHVLRAPTVAARMTHLQTMSTELAYYDKCGVVDKGVIHTSAGPAIEVLWSMVPNQQVESVFFEEDGHWKLDWDEYVRYSTESWPLFLSGDGDAEGEFRLFARMRAKTETLKESEMGISLSQPKFGKPDETSYSSPPIVIDRDSEIGMQMLAAFESRAKGQGAFGSHLVKHDPDQQIRVRVKVSRHGAEEKRVFHIDRLIACHWMELDENAPGAATTKP
jgi:hypothetical protein